MLDDAVLLSLLSASIPLRNNLIIIIFIIRITYYVYTLTEGLLQPCSITL